MSPTLVYTAAAVAAALSMAAVPADAQDRRGEGRERARTRAEQSGGERQDGGRRDDGGGRRAVRRSSEARQAPAVQQAPSYSEGRRYQSPQAVRRDAAALTNAAPRAYGGYQPQAPRYDDRRAYAQPGRSASRHDYRGYVRPPHYQPYRPYYFSRPYYGFRPHVHVGFGVWLGVSVPYPWAYFGAYRPRVYGAYGPGYYGPTYVGVVPAVQQYGGLSFDIQPADADVFVDGEYVGDVGTFTPYGEPLTLYPGVHRVAIVREGFRTMEFDVTIQPGQVIPYRGMLARW